MLEVMETGAPQCTQNSLKFDHTKRSVTFRETTFSLTRTLFALFYLLAEYRGRTIKNTMLCQEILRVTRGHTLNNNCLRVHISRIRKLVLRKIAEEYGVEIKILAIKGGTGYQLSIIGESVEVAPENTADATSASAIHLGPITLVCEEKKIQVNGKNPVYLNTSETAILKGLAQNRGFTATRESLIKLLSPLQNRRSINAFVSNLRRKLLVLDPDEKVKIKTIYRKGYCLILR